MTEKEIRTIKKYYTRPVTAAAYLCTGLLSMFIWIFLDMIRSVVFHLSGSSMEVAYVAIAILLIYMILFLFQGVSVIWGVRRKKWEVIQEKAHTYLSYTDRSAEVLAANTAIAAGRLMSRSDDDRVKTAGDISTAVGGLIGLHAIVSILFEIRKSAKRIADALGMKLPSVKLRVAVIILVPLVLQLAVATPYYVQAVRESREGAARAAVILEKLEQIFEASCDRAYADDPMEYYKDYGYRVTGYLEHEDNDTQSYLSATVNNDGVVEDITYSLDIDVSASKEDNIAQAKADLARLNRALRSADVPFLSPNLGEEHTLREDFITLFQQNSYYENCRSYYDEEGLFIGYYTESQEDYNDYSSSYIYMTVEPPEEES